MTVYKGKPAVFLDRDGTINIEKSYVHHIDEWEWIVGSIEAIRTLNENGFLVIVVSNQAGIARGRYTEADVHLLHSQIVEVLEGKNASIDEFYFCPHHPDYGRQLQCVCRKPQPGLLIEASQKWTIDLTRSWMIGDKLIDVQAGKTAGVETVLVRTGYGNRDIPLADDDQRIADNLLAAVNEVIIPSLSSDK